MKVLKWITLIWTVLAIPYIEDFYGGIYLFLIIGIIAKDLYDAEKAGKKE